MNKQRLKNQAQKRRLEQLEEQKRFVAFRTDSLESLFNLSPNCLKVFIYLKSRINRDPGYTLNTYGKKKRYKVWSNLDKYFNDGYLATIRTQGRIAGRVKLLQPNVSRAIKQLLQAEVMNEIGTESILIAGQKRSVPVYALGELVEVHKTIIEVYYYEIADISK